MQRPTNAPNFKKLAGQRFGRLLVMDYAGDGDWLVFCDCGTKKVVAGSSLRRGLTESCGCIHRLITKRTNRRHGQSKTYLYRTWSDIKMRCSNPNRKCYHNYGGSGIKMYPAWAASFVVFARDVGPRPSREYSLDRINNDGNYEPGNVQWATRIQQGNNTRRNRIIEIDGERRTAAEWCREIGLNYKTFHTRVSRGRLGDREALGL